MRNHKGPAHIPCTAEAVQAEQLAVVFLATPPSVSMDLAPFGWINPCGYAGLATVDMKTLGADAPLADVQQALARQLIDRLKG